MRTQTILAFGIAALFLLNGCGSTVGAAEGRPATSLSAAERAQCHAKGGRVGGFGMFGTPVCFLPFSDAGKTCSDKADCQGNCLGWVEGAQGAIPKAGEERAGQCQATDHLFGCFATVVEGKSTQAVCVD